MLPLKLAIGLPCAAIIGFQPANQAIEALVHHGYMKTGFIEISLPLDHDTENIQETVQPQDVVVTPDVHVPSFDLSDVQKGQSLAGGFIVTSLQGPRVHPVHGTVRHHNGVDVALSGQGGEPLFAPEVVDVVCKVDSGGGGHYAEFGYSGMYWQLLHLQAGSCVAGRHKKGSVIGRIGNTGTGTGSHLHLQLRQPDRSFISVKKGHLEAVLVQQGN
jgi:murein DD-endopeptidase MepM/ murein hydrolase activator NlpD